MPRCRKDKKKKKNEPECTLFLSFGSETLALLAWVRAGRWYWWNFQWRRDEAHRILEYVLATGMKYPNMQLQVFGVFLTSTPMEIAD
jgi:hypothetical protein